MRRGLCGQGMRYELVIFSVRDILAHKWDALKSLLCQKDDPSRTGTIYRMLIFSAEHVFIADFYKCEIPGQLGLTVLTEP